MSYIAENLSSMSDADLRAWALVQTNPSYCMEDRLADATAILNWILDRAGVREESSPSPVKPNSDYVAPAELESSCCRVAEKTSGSSSGCADGESAGELPTPSRNDDALPLKHAASVTVFPPEKKGERP